MTAGAPVPLTVVTGFLGSGKTTLIAALLRRPELARAAVIVNEFGEIGLDHELVEASEEDLVELSTGCICCASRGDLAAAVARLAAKRGEGRAIDRIVLETTGLADPAPIAQAAMVDPALRAFVRLDRIVATVDAVAGIETLDARAESRSQAALADVLLLTKTDMEGARTAEVERRLSALAPHARRVVAVRGAVEPALVLAEEEDADGAAARRAFPDSGPGAHGHDHGHGHENGHQARTRRHRLGLAALRGAASGGRADPVPAGARRKPWGRTCCAPRASSRWPRRRRRRRSSMACGMCSTRCAGSTAGRTGRANRASC